MVVAPLALGLAACSSSSDDFNQTKALTGVDIILAAYPADATGQGPTLLTCPFGDVSTLAQTLATAGGAKLGTLGKPTLGISPWSSGTDGGRAISCSATSPTFAFAVGVQRGRKDEHPATGAGWTGPTNLGGGNLYISSSTSTKLCSAAWAHPGTFFTVGIQIASASLTADQCKAAGKAGVTAVVKALDDTKPFNVVPSTGSSSGVPIPTTSSPGS